MTDAEVEDLRRNVRAYQTRRVGRRVPVRFQCGPLAGCEWPSRRDDAQRAGAVAVSHGWWWRVVVRLSGRCGQLPVTARSRLRGPRLGHSGKNQGNAEEWVKDPGKRLETVRHAAAVPWILSQT